MSNDPVNDFLMGGGAPSCRFDTIGRTWSGRILDAEVRQQTDLDGELKTWPNGDPMMQVVLTLQTDETDPNIVDDDGRRRLFVKGQMQAAVREAIRAAGANQLERGATLAVQYTGDGERKGGKNPPKLYRAQYQPPAVTVDDLMGGEAPAPAGTPATRSVAATDLLPS